ncbi:MAG: hypothetical protein ACMXYG_01550, partial [Candidatus Woesearchaeota archaeon]
CDYVCDDALGCDYAPIECSSDLDCGSSVSSNSCVDGNYVTTTSTPTCYNPGTIGSYCEDVVSSATEICDYICDDALGCDYAPIECSSDLDCGLSSLSYSCVDGNYVTTETVPTCFNSGTVYSFCFDIVSSTTEICDYACDDALGCDYAPIECSSDLDCGLSSLSYSCVDGNYVTTETVPTCFAAGTIDSYCEDVFSSTTEICEYSCDETFGCIVPELEASLSCFDNLVVGNEQVCSVFVNAFYGIVSDAMVSLYAREIGSFGEPVLIGTCITDLLSGGCQVQWVEENLGESEVFALVTKDGHIDADIGPFSYMVYSERYEIFNLKVFSDNNYLNESYDFFRGEDMYVSFNTWDLIEQDWAIDLVSLAVLTSPPGGMAYLDPVSQVDGEYRFRLTPIPPTHEFLGDSQVFTFVFNFSDASGGQANVNLIIRNNIPVVFSIPNQVLGVGESVTLDLDNYGYDIEDELIWVASNVDDSILEVVVQENELYILGLSQGENLITLTAFDLNNDFASTTVLVTVLPIECSTNLDCGVSSLSYSCVDGNYVTTETVPTCFAAGTIDSYCEDVLIPTVEICDYACDDVLGCDYAPIECSTDLDCGVSIIGYSCDNNIFTTIHVTPVCVDAGTINSYCSEDVNIEGVACNYICSVDLGCDYAPIECSTDLDCGVSSLSYSCVDGNYVTTETVPTCFAAGTIDSYCEDVLIPAVEICDYACDDALGCDYAPVQCSTDLDCGVSSLSYSCVDGNYVTTETVPTCFAAGTIDSYCEDVLIPIVEICDYACDDVLGCDYAPIECSTDLDCGVSSLSYSCVDGNYVTTETVPTCYNAGVIGSYCVDLVVPTTDICAYTCDDTFGCDNMQALSTYADLLIENFVFIDGGKIVGLEDAVVHSGDDFTLGITFRNRGNTRLENVRILAAIPELGISRRIHRFDVEPGERVSTHVALWVPYDVVPDEYIVRLIVYDKDVRRVQHRYVTII